MSEDAIKPEEPGGGAKTATADTAERRTIRPQVALNVALAGVSALVSLGAIFVLQRIGLAMASILVMLKLVLIGWLFYLLQVKSTWTVQHTLVVLLLLGALGFTGFKLIHAPHVGNYLVDSVDQFTEVSGPSWVSHKDGLSLGYHREPSAAQATGSAADPDSERLAREAVQAQIELVHPELPLGGQWDLVLPLDLQPGSNGFAEVQVGTARVNFSSNGRELRWAALTMTSSTSIEQAPSRTSASNSVKLELRNRPGEKSLEVWVGEESVRLPGGVGDQSARINVLTNGDWRASLKSYQVR